MYVLSLCIDWPKSAFGYSILFPTYFVLFFVFPHFLRFIHLSNSKFSTSVRFPRRLFCFSLTFEKRFTRQRVCHLFILGFEFEFSFDLSSKIDSDIFCLSWPRPTWCLFWRKFYLLQPHFWLVSCVLATPLVSILLTEFTSSSSSSSYLL